METEMLSNLRRPPIVEAVLDIDCDMPPGFDVLAVEDQATAVLGEGYPKLRRRYTETHQVTQHPDAEPELTKTRRVDSLLFLQEDEAQIVQVRGSGYSFNRLAPYKGFDEYLPEIERTWQLFSRCADPLTIKLIRLRYINRIELPAPNGKLELNDFFKCGPKLPDEKQLKIIGFLHQHAVGDPDTRNQANIILTSPGAEKDSFPCIFDIEAFRQVKVEVGNWEAVVDVIDSLRRMKNMIFQNSLEPKCLELF